MSESDRLRSKSPPQEPPYAEASEPIDWMGYNDLDELPSSGGLKFLDEGESQSLPTM